MKTFLLLFVCAAPALVESPAMPPATAPVSRNACHAGCAGKLVHSLYQSRSLRLLEAS
jgi:hypothetical protein